MVVIVIHKLLRYRPHFIEVVEQVSVQHRFAVGFVETLDIGVLGGFPRLYVLELYPVHLAPILRYFGYKLGAVVHAYVLRFPVPVHQVLQHPDYPAALQRIVRLDEQDLAVVVVYHVEGPELRPVAQHIAHEIDAPGVGELPGHVQGLFHPCGQTLLCLAPQGHAHLFVDAVQFFMVHGPAHIAQAVVALPKTFRRVSFGQFFKPVHIIRIVFDRCVVQAAPAEPQQTTRLADVFGPLLADGTDDGPFLARL